MENEPRAGDAQASLKGLMLVRSLFKDHFGDIEDVPSPNDNAANGSSAAQRRRRGGAPPRVPPSRVLFSLCAAVVEKHELIGRRLWDATIWQIVFDLPLQSQRQHCDGCLKALSSVGLAKYETVSDKRPKGHPITRDYYTIDIRFMDRILAYINDILHQCACIQATLTREQMIVAAQRIFDYLQYKYLPEWNLLIRKIERVQMCLSEKHEKQANFLLHCDPNTWILVHLYIAWLGNDYTSKRPFDTLIKEIAGSFSHDEYDFAKAQFCIQQLSSKNQGVKLFERVSRDLKPDPRLEEPIRVYLREIHKEYDEFVSDLRAWTYKLQESAPAQSGGAQTISASIRA